MFQRMVVGLLLMAAGAGIGRSVGRAQASAPAKKHRAVFHVNVPSEDGWQEILTNVENVQKAFGPDAVEIEVVAHGAGIGLVQLKNTALRERIEAIEKTGPVFAACSNTLRKRELSAADLTPGVKVVDSGLAEIVRREEQGWSYVKLGD
jgi:intracellular sulfur oxidation DsrE/DsrF family protein